PRRPRQRRLHHRHHGREGRAGRARAPARLLRNGLPRQGDRRPPLARNLAPARLGVGRPHPRLLRARAEGAPPRGGRAQDDLLRRRSRGPLRSGLDPARSRRRPGGVRSGDRGREGDLREPEPVLRRVPVRRGQRRARRRRGQAHGQDAGRCPARAGLPADAARRLARALRRYSRRIRERFVTRLGARPKRSTAWVSMWSIASSTESVMRSSPTSSASIVPASTARTSMARRGCQYSRPIRTIGKSWIFFVWMRVRASKSSSIVPTPPGITTKAYEYLTSMTLRTKKCSNVTDRST